MIRYCTRCVMPATKPDLKIDEEGVCSACRAFERRKEVDWSARRAELAHLIERHRNPASGYDCIVPASGGKDSHFQVLAILEMGYKPLVVTATTDHLTDLGRRNIENLKRQGVDYLEVSCNPIVRRKLNAIGLRTVGDISWPEHVSIFTIPVRVAVQYQIPLIVWGENSQNEYGGPAGAEENPILSRRWLEEFGGLLGLRVSDLSGQEGITERDLWIYTYPTQQELDQVGVTGLFLGYYVPWDGWANAYYAQGFGFESYPHMVEGSLASYENLDNAQTGVHDYFKWLKFAFGRASDIASLHVRRGRLRRDQAVRLVQRHDGRFPWTYLGVPLEDVLGPVGMDVLEFVELCDRFATVNLFQTDADGKLMKRADGSPQRINEP